MDPMNQQSGGGECAGCEAKVRELEAQIAAMQGGDKAAPAMDPAFATFKAQRAQQLAMQSDPDYAMFLAKQRAKNMAENAAADARSKMEMNRMLSAKRPGPAVPPSGALDALLG